MAAGKAEPLSEHEMGPGWEIMEVGAMVAFNHGGCAMRLMMNIGATFSGGLLIVYAVMLTLEQLILRH
ncbi:hypothetical protein SAMN02745126_05957 [Enhydrobacter aerosaccus]|uniref:Uncharacterized protein n=1 Tax=Enhydrobacter aerosaccus TaxID=225324 RepID=A0A1T4TBM2_9HYPH|nr:hypothetical protein [Enhydrobacter aerosaccus]SKA37786.1 hypothetical protein SAMN02745126_05957 [Enhydrobacter aerosaccus]